MRLPRLNRANVSAYLEPARTLTADTPRRFGTMSSTEMVRHLRHTLEVSCGAKEDLDRSNWFTRGIGRVLVFHLMPAWPGGVIKQPDSWTPKPEDDFAAEHQRFLKAIERFVDEQENTPDRITISPLLGPQTLEYWGHIHSVHFNHHFRQFDLN